MNTYTDLLIDIDGTLSDTFAIERCALSDVLTKHDITFSEEILILYSEINEKLWQEYEKLIITKDELRKRRFSILFKKIGLGKRTDIEQIASEYFEAYSTTVMPVEKMNDIIKYLSSKYTLHIISNGSTDIQYYKLDKMQIRDYFASVFLSDEIGYAKPDRRFYQYVYNHINQPDKNRVLVIGDSLTADIEGGRNFGFATCHISKACYATADISLKALSGLYEVL